MKKRSRIQRARIDIPRTGIVLGELHGVIYETDRYEGKRQKYLHRFKKGSRPLLVTGHDGRGLYIVGGRYTVTDSGIVDNPASNL